MAASDTLVVQLPGLGRQFRLDEWVHGSLYSRVRYDQNQSSTIDAFSYIRGQTVPSGGSAATERDTNMFEAGKLANGWEALIFSHQILPPNNIDDADIRDVDTKALYVLRVGRTPVYEAPLHRFPQGGGVGLVSTNSATEQVSNGTTSPRDQRSFLIPIQIREGKVFSVENRFPSALSQGTQGRLWQHFLEGLIRRPIDVG